jgi:hypothetical protein
VDQNEGGEIEYKSGNRGELPSELPANFSPDEPEAKLEAGQATDNNKNIYDMSHDTCPMPFAANGKGSSTPKDKGSPEGHCNGKEGGSLSHTMPRTKEKRHEGKPGPYCGRCTLKDWPFVGGRGGSKAEKTNRKAGIKAQKSANI